MKNQTMPGGTDKKTPFIYNLIFFISFAAFIFLVEGDAFLDGGDWQKYFESFARVLVPLAIAFYFSFYRPIVGFVRANTSLTEKLIALAGAVPLGIKITIDFFNSFFMQVLNGGSSPVLVKRVFDMLNLSPNSCLDHAPIHKKQSAQRMDAGQKSNRQTIRYRHRSIVDVGRTLPAYAQQRA